MEAAKKNPNCSCPITACKRHGNCKDCMANHKGRGFCKRPNWQQKTIRLFVRPKKVKAAPQ